MGVSVKRSEWHHPTRPEQVTLLLILGRLEAGKGFPEAATGVNRRTDLVLD